jgi:hypothetical protein
MVINIHNQKRNDKHAKPNRQLLLIDILVISMQLIFDSTATNQQQPATILNTATTSVTTKIVTQIKYSNNNANKMLVILNYNISNLTGIQHLQLQHQDCYQDDYNTSSSS